MTINMPVEVLSEKCLNCPEIDINTFTRTNTIVEKVHEDGNIVSKNVSETTLRCTNYEKCRLMYEMVFSAMQVKKDAAAAKKTTTKKTTTSKTRKTRNTKASD